MNSKITLPELVSRLAAATSTTKRMSELFLRELFATITQSLIDGENVTIKDLGQFKRIGKTTIEFVPAKKLAETLNQPFEVFTPIVIGDDVTDDMLSAVEAAPTVATTHGQSDVETEVDLPVAPPPFNAGAEETSVTLEKEEEPEPVTVAPIVEPQQVHDKQEMIADEEQESVKHYSLTDIENAKREVKRKTLWQGIGIGAASMLALCLLAWMLMRPSRPLPAGGLTDTASTADTIAKVKADDPVATEPIVTDTTSTTMYLSRMSKKHYGRAEFWVYIYEENKAIIADPNNIPPGTVVVIPPVSKYGIDASDEVSIKRAKQKSYELFSAK